MPISKGARILEASCRTRKKDPGYFPASVRRMPASPRTAVEGSPMTPFASGRSCSASMFQSPSAVGPPYRRRIFRKFSSPMLSS